jgi:hypothetical protein
LTGFEGVPLALEFLRLDAQVRNASSRLWTASRGIRSGARHADALELLDAVVGRLQAHARLRAPVRAPGAGWPAPGRPVAATGTRLAMKASAAETSSSGMPGMLRWRKNAAPVSRRHWSM